MRDARELRAQLEAYLAELALTPELGELAAPVRYALAGGKRVRGTLCLAVADAAGCQPDAVLPAAGALELVHAFSLVHDDLPAIDDDAMRRGRPSAHAQFGEGVALLAGDALLAEAFRLALAYPSPAVARELVGATLGMIGGQYLDLAEGLGDELAVSRLKTGRLFEAAVGCALSVAEVPERVQTPWRAFAVEVGLLFQLVDDVLDGDGYVAAHGVDAARALADEASGRALACLGEISADTSVLASIVAGLVARTS